MHPIKVLFAHLMGLIPSCIGGSLADLPGKKRQAYNGVNNQ